MRSVGELAGLPGSAVAERLGPDGRRAWSLARGKGRGKVRGRRQVEELAQTLEFPEAIGNELTLRRALAVLVDGLLANPERADRFLRKVALSATLGWGVALAAVTVFVYQGALSLGATLFEDILKGEALDALTSAGGVLIIGISLKLLDLTDVKVGNFLPALVFAPALVGIVSAID